MSESNRKYEILLASVITARSTSFIFSKMLLTSMDTFALLAIRFLIAFVLLSLVFIKKMIRMNWKTLVFGVIVGAIYFLVMACELTALSGADSSIVSLLENCSIILVPLFNAILTRKLPGKMAIICAVVAMTGVVMLTALTGTFNWYVLFAIASAFFYAIVIIVTGRLTQGDADAFCMGIIQLGTLGLLALIVSLCKKSFVIPTQWSQWSMILVLVAVCTGFGFTLQPLAQKYVAVERAGLFCAIEPLVATALGAIVLHEKLTVLTVSGMVLILLSIVLPYTPLKKLIKN